LQRIFLVFVLGNEIKNGFIINEELIDKYKMV